MECVLHVDSQNTNVRTHGRKRHFIGVICARRLGVGLRHRKPAYNFEYQISALVFLISGVQQVLELGIRFQPAVGISVRFMADAIRLSASRRIHNRSRHSDALLMHNQPERMVDVVPQAVIAAGVWRWSRSWSWRRRRSL